MRTQNPRATIVRVPPGASTYRDDREVNWIRNPSLIGIVRNERLRRPDRTLIARSGTVPRPEAREAVGRGERTTTLRRPPPRPKG